MNAQHTQGEWQVSRIAAPNYAPQFGIYAGDSHTALAVVRGDNSAVDALLIAAAPTMLVALQEIVWQYGEKSEAGEIARAAINRATLP